MFRNPWKLEPKVFPVLCQILNLHPIFLELPRFLNTFSFPSKVKKILILLFILYIRNCHTFWGALIIFCKNENKKLANIWRIKNHKIVSICKVYNILGGVVAYWLVQWTLEWGVGDQVLAGKMRCVLGQDTLLSQCLSSPRCINGYRLIFCWGWPCGGLAPHTGRSTNTPGHFILQKPG